VSNIVAINFGIDKLEFTSTQVELILSKNYKRSCRFNSTRVDG